jgi:hypothetical protein
MECEVYFANFNIKSEIDNCKNNSGKYTVHFFHLAFSIELLSTREQGRNSVKNGGFAPPPVFLQEQAYIIFSFLQDEKTFFVFSKKSSPKEYTVSTNGVNCDPNYPTSHFTARITPSKDYPIPMYFFSSSYHTSLISNMDAVLDDLIGYFYVSKTSQKNSSAIYYSMEVDWYGEYISEFSATPLDGNWTENGAVVYVKSHQNHQGIARILMS